jgi:transposase InsO family protein
MSDVPKLRYVFPKFKPGYNRAMKTLISSLKYESSDPAQFRFHVLQHGGTYGVASAVSAFGVSRRSYFRWKSKLEKRNRLADLVPHATTPKRTRRMLVDDRLVLFIKEIREEYGRVGKYKLKVLLDAYAIAHGLPLYGPTKIAKIVKRYNYFFEKTKRTKRLRFQRERVKYAPKIKSPGYLEIDCVHIVVETHKLVFVTIIDLATKVAYAEAVLTASAKNTVEVLSHFTRLHKIKVHTIQTDNGSEFLGSFHDYLVSLEIKHCFSYPRSPRINGVIERFNRTIQEEHIERTMEWWCDRESATIKLTKYLEWYNFHRPHASLSYQTPMAALKSFT